MSVVPDPQFGYYRQEVAESNPLQKLQTEGAVNFEEAGKLIDGELKKFVEFVEQKVRPKTRQEMAQLLRKASKNLTKAAQSLEKR